MPASLAHTVFTGAVAGGSLLARRLGTLIFRAVGEAAVDMAARATISLAIDTAEDAINSTVEQLENLSIDALGSLIGVRCPGFNDDQFVDDEPTVTRILNVVAETEGGPQQLAEAFEKQARDFQFSQELSNQVANISFPAGCAIGILRAENDLVATRKFPDGSGAPSRIRNCQRRSTDGQRVSREVHEWEYCRRSQWGDVLAEVQQYAQRINGALENEEPLPTGFEFDDLITQQTIEEIANGQVISFATIDYTFGNFVDAVNMRRGIEQFRRTNRAVTGDRFTDLLNLLGMSKDEIVAKINNETNWSRQLRELVRLDVKPLSGQRGSIPDSNLTQ